MKKLFKQLLFCFLTLLLLITQTGCVSYFKLSHSELDSPNNDFVSVIKDYRNSPKFIHVGEKVFQVENIILHQNMISSDTVIVDKKWIANYDLVAKCKGPKRIRGLKSKLPQLHFFVNELEQIDGKILFNKESLIETKKFHFNKSKSYLMTSAIVIGSAIVYFVIALWISLS